MDSHTVNDGLKTITKTKRKFMKASNYLGIVLAVPVMLACVGSANAATVASPLTATPATVALTYQKPSTGSSVAVKVSATASTFFTVDLASVPIWLSLDAVNGTAVAAPGTTINFSASPVAATLGAGTYTASVNLKVAPTATSTYSDKTVAVTLVIKNVAAVLSTKESTTQNIDWPLGSALPTFTLNPRSNADPIAYTAAAAVTLPASPTWLLINHTSGLAYTVGSTPIAVTYVPQVFALAIPGDQLKGTITLTPASGSPVVVNLVITVTPPQATISSLYPKETAVQPSATTGAAPLTVVLTGSGFVAAPETEKTVVTVGGSALPTGSVSVSNSTTITIQIPAETYLTAPLSLDITAQNPNPNGTPAAASATTLAVTVSPIIYSIVNSASYMQPATGPTLVPYEAISIFGDNFGADPVTPTLGALDGNSRFPAKLTPVTAKDLVVKFYKQDGTTLIDSAYVLFATQNQINCLVPSGVSATGITGLKISVTYDSVESSKFTANLGTADPGIYTTASSGLGQAAILHSDYSVNSSTNKVAKLATVQIYVTGLGAPTSTATNVTSATAVTYPASCISTAAYLGTMNAAPISASWTNIDGAVLASANIATGHFAPCFLTTGTGITPVTVLIDGKAATVTYAGFVSDSVAGLYQVNAIVPSTATSGAAISVQVVVGTAKSQIGATMAIQ
jgi:uncharacterized protein (TIGR03437 family)